MCDIVYLYIFYKYVNIIKCYANVLYVVVKLSNYSNL